VGKGDEVMREIVNKYLNELKQIQQKCSDDNDNINKEYQDKVEGIFKDISLKYINEMRYDIKNRCYPKNEKYQRELVNFKILWHLFDDFRYEYIPVLFNKADKENWKPHAKIRLFMMFVKAFGEVIYLLEGGYASCALTRIRYIYEIGVYIEIIEKASQDVAKKFLQYSNGNRLKLADSLKDRKLQSKIKKDLRKYGRLKVVLKPYRWAKNVISNEKITFKNLAETTDLYQHYSMYIFSSWSVHADVYGSANSIELSSTENDRMWATTPSNIGAELIISYLKLLIAYIPCKYFSVPNECISIFVCSVISEFISSV